MYCKKCGAKLNEQLIFVKTEYNEETGKRKDFYHKRIFCPNNTKFLGVFNTHKDEIEGGYDGDRNTRYLCDSDGNFLRFE